MIKVLTYEQIVKKMVGEINPIGETNEDSLRYENLTDMCFLVDSLVSLIAKVAHNNKDKAEYSMKKAGNFAQDFLKNLIES